MANRANENIPTRHRQVPTGHHVSPLSLSVSKGRLESKPECMRRKAETTGPQATGCKSCRQRGKKCSVKRVTLPAIGYTGFCANKSSLDCPVLRLTLLFFGAAKDVPEAAKMVTAGTACLDSRAN
jgi:hypothetical protein